MFETTHIKLFITSQRGLQFQKCREDFNFKWKRILLLRRNLCNDAEHVIAYRQSHVSMWKEVW